MGESPGLTRRTGARLRRGVSAKRHWCAAHSEGVASHYGMQPGMVGDMSTQIAVRLPDEVVAFLDRAVASGKARSRAALVAAAVEREMRRQAAEHDAQILTERGPADDLDDLVQWASTHVEVGD